MKLYEISDAKGIDNLKMVERATPKPGPGEVLVRVRSTSLNYRDLVTVKGTCPQHQMSVDAAFRRRRRSRRGRRGGDARESRRPRRRDFHAGMAGRSADQFAWALGARRRARRDARRIRRAAMKTAWFTFPTI